MSSSSEYKHNYFNFKKIIYKDMRNILCFKLKHVIIKKKKIHNK